MPIVVHELIFTIIPQRAPALLRPLIKPVFTNVIKRFVNPELKANCEMVIIPLSSLLYLGSLMTPWHPRAIPLTDRVAP